MGIFIIVVTMIIIPLALIIYICFGNKFKDPIDYDIYHYEYPYDDAIKKIHFESMVQIQEYYKRRDKYPNALQKTIEACYKQISVAPRMAEKFRKEGMVNEKGKLAEGHEGYHRLAVIFERHLEEFDKAIEISKKAMDQGWAGSWESRIARCKRKKEKSEPVRHLKDVL